MINYIKYPKIVDLAQNNCGLIVSGSNLYINQGTYGSFVLAVNPLGIAKGDYHFPDLINGGMVITVTTSPDDSGYQIKSGKSGFELAKELRQNYILEKTFDIWEDGNNINFKSKDKGDYDITNNVYAPTVPAGASIQNIIDGVAVSVNSGYKIFYIVAVERDYQSDIYESFEFYGDADEDGQLQIQLKSFLESFFQEKDLPLVNQNSPTKCIHSIKRYRISTAEFYDGVMRKLYETSDYFVLDGKVRPEDYVDLNIPDLINNTLTYLKHTISEILTTSKAQQYLYYLAPTSNPNQHYLKTEKFFSDGTVSEVVNINQVSSLTAYEILLIPVGFNALGFDSHAKADLIYKYQVSLWDVSGKQLGKLMTYFVRNWTDHDMIFLYENRYGVFDTFIGTGEVERDNGIMLSVMN